MAHYVLFEEDGTVREVEIPYLDRGFPEKISYARQLWLTFKFILWLWRRKP